MCDEIWKSPEEQREFERWAFGRSPVTYTNLMMHTWNSRHGDLYFAECHERTDESIREMNEIYKREKAMDKIIRKIEKTVAKDTKKEEKQLKGLEKADKKRDKACDVGERVLKRKGNKK